MTDALKDLKERLAEIEDYQAIFAVLEWDQQVNMPPEGAEGRGYAIARIAERAHNLSVSEEMIRSQEDAEKAVIGISQL